MALFLCCYLKRFTFPVSDMPRSSRVIFRQSQCQYQNKSKKNRQILEPCRRTKTNKLWYMLETVISFVVVALGTVPNGFKRGLEELEIEGKIDPLQTRALLKSARILRRVLETWGDLSSLKLLWKTISWCCWENFVSDTTWWWWWWWYWRALLRIFL